MFHHSLYIRFIRLSKGYYHCESLSKSLYQLLPLPRCSVRRNAGGAPGRHFSVKHKKIHFQSLFEQQLISYIDTRKAMRVTIGILHCILFGMITSN